MLSPSTRDKLKKLETSLEVSLIDELNTKKIIEIALERLMEMHNEGLIDVVERNFILRSLRGIIQEEEMFAKMLIKNCDTLISNVNNVEKTIVSLGK